MGHNRIVKECARGKFLDTLIHRYSALVFDDIFFVDRGLGNDSNDGESFDTALKTIEAAMDKCTDYKQNAVIYRGRTTSGQKHTALQVIDKSGVHLLGSGALFGFGGGWNSTFMPPTAFGAVTGGSDGTRSHAGIQIDARDVEIAGMKFYTYDPNTVTTRGFYIMCIKAGGVPYGFNSIHDNILQGDVLATGLIGGISMEGMERGYIGYNYLYELEEGIVLQTGGSDYETGIEIEENRYQGNKYGIRLLNGACLNHVKGEKMWGAGALVRGYAITNGILIAAGANNNLVEDSYVATAVELTAITDGGTDNNIVDCWYGVGPGAKTIWNGP
jgi:hypothetical protein